MKFTPDSNYLLVKSQSIPIIYRYRFKDSSVNSWEKYFDSRVFWKNHGQSEHNGFDSYDISADSRYFLVEATTKSGSCEVVVCNSLNMGELRRKQFHKLRVGWVAAAFSPDGDKVVLFLMTEVRIWMWKSDSSEVITIDSHPQAVFFTALNDLVFYGGQTLRPRRTWRKSVDATSTSSTRVHFGWSSMWVTCSHDNKYLVACAGNHVRLYDYDGNLKVAIIQNDVDQPSRGSQLFHPV